MVLQMLARTTLILAALAALAATLAGCGGDTGEQANQPANESSNSIVPALPAAVSVMDRAGLLAAVAQAASAAAAGLDDSGVQRKMDGQPFEIRLRFGCKGPSEADEKKVMSWRFDEASRTLRLRAQPDISIQGDVASALAGEAFEAVEGFWIPRPWLQQPVCPAMATPPAPQPAAPLEEPKEEQASAEPAPVAAPPPPKLVGIAQFFSATDSRTLRRDGRAYESTKALSVDESPSTEGYNLVLTGRLKRLPNGRVIACAVERPEQSPRCIASVDFDRVWIERPDTQATIAEWSAGG